MQVLASYRSAIKPATSMAAPLAFLPAFCFPHLPGLGLPPAFQSRIGKGDGKLGIHGRPDHGGLDSFGGYDGVET